MLENILGGTEELEKELEALREERDKLQERLDSEQEKRKDAVSDYQQAREKINKLEDKISGLEGELSAAKGAETENTSKVQQVELTQSQGRCLINWLQSYDGPDESAFTAYVDENISLASESTDIDYQSVNEAAPCFVFMDETGLIKLALEAPGYDGDEFSSWDTEFELKQNWFLPDSTAFAVVRSDMMAYGDFEETDLTNYRTITSNVKSNHSKGGFSQSRFEQIRENQIKEHLNKVREFLESQQPDSLILVGDKDAVQELNDLADVTATSDVTETGEDNLESAFHEFWRVTAFRL